MRNVLWVGAGGALGSVARYLVGVAVPVRVGNVPWGTMIVNVSGAFVLGFLAGWLGDRLSEHVRLGLAVGVLGGYTTFSSWALDSVELFRVGRHLPAFANIGVALLLGLGAAAAGLAAGLAVARA